MTREIKFRVWSTFHNKEELIYLNEFTSKDLKSCDNWKVMQYTGVVDKNGKDIYEGDIVEITQKTETFFDKVIYDNRLCSFRFEGLSDYCDFCDWLREGAEFEVVGNIYENSKLIGGEND